MCGLDADEVAAIGEHEHIPDIAAAALADLSAQTITRNTSWSLIVEDIHKALDAGHIRHGAHYSWRCCIFGRRVPRRIRN